MVRVLTVITVSQVISRSLWVGVKFCRVLLVIAILLVQWLLNSWYLFFWKLRTEEILSRMIKAPNS